MSRKECHANNVKKYLAKDLIVDRISQITEISIMGYSPMSTEQDGLHYINYYNCIITECTFSCVVSMCVTYNQYIGYAWIISQISAHS